MAAEAIPVDIQEVVVAAARAARLHVEGAHTTMVVGGMPLISHVS